MNETLTSLSDYPLARRGESAGKNRRRARPLRSLAAALAVLGAVAFLFANEPHGGGIRADLAAAASRLKDVPQNASAARVTAELRGEFTGESATIDPSGFPAAVTVTLHALDRASCATALRSARRIEGRVVVVLEGYASSAQCADSNDMTWRIMQ
jgi:hypothetical protein